MLLSAEQLHYMIGFQPARHRAGRVSCFSAPGGQNAQMKGRLV
ncbi:Hypothetical protein GbCGDNIH6_7238a [Granulibacter bethesdensis]|nr:Hypothetical protein GbCGDNIH6_7238a [Granulibacter bethesdensis]